MITFLQTASWYRRSIYNFADIARPLTNLTEKKSSWQWLSEQQDAFEKLKVALTTAPVLRQAGCDTPFTIKTDGSQYAIGAVVMLSAVVDQSLAPYSGPDIQLFKRFENNWNTIDQSDFKTIKDDSEANILAELVADRISFANKQLHVHKPRDDYRELLNLTIIFFGSDPGKGI